VRLHGRDEPVVCLYDNLCLGRLESIEARAAWMFQFLDEDDYVEIAADLEKTWSEVLDPANDLTVWFSRTCVPAGSPVRADGRRPPRVQGEPDTGWRLADPPPFLTTATSRPT
jgi:hypothetical protein